MDQYLNAIMTINVTNESNDIIKSNKIHLEGKNRLFANYDKEDFHCVYFGVSKLELVLRYINGPKKLLRGFLVVHELALRARAGIQYFVPVL